MPRTWPLVGRDEELRVAGRALGPRNDRSGGVVLSGPAGVGKSRLAREVVARAAAGVEPHWVLATESARELPLGAFGGLVDDATPIGVDSIARVAESLCARGPGRPLIGIDDAHLLDDLSAVLVHRLVTRDLATVVLTLRDADPVPHAITALWKDDYLPRLPLAPLTEASTRELLERVLGAPLASDAVRRLWSLTRGNALFLRLLVDGEVAAGRVIVTDGAWHWSDDPGISHELAEIVRHQMGDLPSKVRDAVDVLALAEPLGVDVIESLTGAAAIEEAEDRGLVRVDQDAGRLLAQLTHPMYGEVRRADLGAVRARRLRGLIATTLVADGEARREPIRCAVLAVDSDLPPDAGLLLTAARSALEHFDVPLGERLARAAADVSGDFEARLALAFALSWMPRPDEAEQLLAELATEAVETDQRVRVAVPRVANLCWTARRPDLAQEVLAEALADTPSGAGRAALLGMGVAVDASLCRTANVVETGTDLLAGGELADVAEVLTAAGVVMAAGVSGQLSIAMEAGRTGQDAAVGTFNTVGPHFCLAEWGALALRLAGRVRRVEQLAAGIAAGIVDVPGPVQAMSRMVSGHAALCAGRVGTALQHLRAAREVFQDSHPFADRTTLLLCQATALSGDPTRGRVLLRAIPRGEDRIYVATEPEEILAAAWVAAAEGAISEAVETCHAAAASAAEANAPAYEVLALQTATQYGDAAGLPRLGELVGIVEGPRAPAAHAHARALAAHDGDALAAVSEQWEGIGDLIAAADASAQAALQHLRRGRKGSALAAAHRAHRLADGPCEGLRTPALAAAERPLPLTHREREIATLAARGLTNRDIAERLTVSVRTVEGHLYRAGNKLGVHERSEFAQLLAIE